MSFIEFESVYKRYTAGEIVIPAVDGVSFQIEEGEFCLIVGASGAGKSTVLNMLGGMDSCDDGKIRVAGRLINNLSKNELINYRRYDVGFVFQFYNLVPNLTALENVELASQISKKALNPRKVLEKVGLRERMDNFPSQLSGGEQQRVSIARALAKNPKLLLCDEPTGALDYRTGKQILRLLQRTCRETGTTVVVITHNQALAGMADRIITMRSGRVIQIAVNDHPVSVDMLEW
ncbi:MAG: ABC transporter ATP-binding protein [Clostridia bacterium]|nr:ABC transporter ATP-binding protein [Clostridia bacterium]